jgi:hypothetical protein
VARLSRTLIPKHLSRYPRFNGRILEKLTVGYEGGTDCNGATPTGRDAAVRLPIKGSSKV